MFGGDVLIGEHNNGQRLNLYKRSNIENIEGDFGNKYSKGNRFLIPFDSSYFGNQVTERTKFSPAKQ